MEAEEKKLLEALADLTLAIRELKDMIAMNGKPEPSQILDGKQAAELLKCSIRSLETYRQNWIEGVHYFRQAKGYRYNRVLLEDWLKNQFDPHAHQIAIETWLQEQPSRGRKKRNG